VRARVAAATLVAAVVWLAWAIGSGGGVPLAERPPAAGPRPSSTPVPTPSPTALPVLRPLARNIFEYAREPSPPLLPAATPATLQPHPAEAAPSPGLSVRLVGLVGSTSEMKVALAVDGQIVVLAPGEAQLGYRVLAIDEDTEVRVSGPDGELVLPLP
jgi:hypothetical protein